MAYGADAYCEAYDRGEEYFNLSINVEVEEVPDSDFDGVPDPLDDCPDVYGSAELNGCLHADETYVLMKIIDLQRSGICGYKPNGRARIACTALLENIGVRVYDREDEDFLSCFGRRPPRHLLDDIYENPVGLLGAAETDEYGRCLIGEDHPGKFLVIAKFEDTELGKTIYTGKFKNFLWNRGCCWWHCEWDDDDEDGFTPPDVLTKYLHITKLIRRNGDIRYLGGFKTIVTGSQLDIYHSEYTIWEGDRELYPFLFTSEEDWEVNVCLHVPEGYRIAGVLDENEEVVATDTCIDSFVAGESKVFLFEVNDLESPEPDVTFGLTAMHDGKIDRVRKKIGGVRKWNEKKLEKRIHRKVKKLAPRWKKRFERIMKRMKVNRVKIRRGKTQGSDGGTAVMKKD